MIGELAARVGDDAVAAFYGELARRLAALEAAWVPRFDRAYVGSRADAAWLAARFAGVEVRVLPNTVDVPPWRERARAPGPTRFLFVGALAYYPNIDALAQLERAIVPRLAAAGAPFELHVVGRGAPRWLEARLRARPEIRFHGGVPAMAPHYAAADAVVVPLRAGGGTRIKLLEAFAHGVPVITTSVGAFGLDVAGGRDVVIADGDEAFGEACRGFIADPGSGVALARNAHAYVQAHHRPEIFAEKLRA